MRNYLTLYTLLLPLALPAYAETSGTPSMATHSLSERSLQLPRGWKELSHKEWLEVLDIETCDAENEDSEARLKNWVILDEESRLLLLICGLGAYQDAFHVYAVNTSTETVEQLTLEPPPLNDEAGHEREELTRGSVYKADDKEAIELLHLSAATGACGWRARYPIKSVKQAGLVKSTSVYADSDCYN